LDQTKSACVQIQIIELELEFNTIQFNAFQYIFVVSLLRHEAGRQAHPVQVLHNTEPAEDRHLRARQWRRHQNRKSVSHMHSQEAVEESERAATIHVLYALSLPFFLPFFGFVIK